MSRWDAFLSSPGLSHLATEIFLELDLESFVKVRQVCRAWKQHFDESDLWKKKLMKLAGPATQFRRKSPTNSCN